MSEHLPEDLLGDAEMITMLHRHDGGVAFTRLDNGKMPHLWHVPVENIPAAMPAMREYLSTDAYFGLNGLTEPLRSNAGKGEPVPSEIIDERLPYPQPFRRAINLHALTSCYLDLDSEQIGMRDVEAVGKILVMQDDGLVPPPSIIERSGRGVWCFWALHDEAQQSPRGTWRNQRIWSLVQRELASRLAELNPDPKVTNDVVRVSRLPGTINSKSGKTVMGWIQYGPGRRPHHYTLDGLAALLNVAVPKLAEDEQAGERPKKRMPRVLTRAQREHLARGRMKRPIIRADMIRTLSRLRGGFDEGHRQMALLYLATALCQASEPRDLAAKECRALADAFKGNDPPSVESVIRSVWRTCRTHRPTRTLVASDQTVAESLDITVAEAEALDEQLDRRRRFPCSSNYERPRPSTRNEKRDRRHALFREVVQRDDEGIIRVLSPDRVWMTCESVRELHEALTAEYGIEVSVEQIRLDLKAVHPFQVSPPDR